MPSKRSKRPSLAQGVKMAGGWFDEYPPDQQRKIADLCAYFPAELQPAAREATARALIAADNDAVICHARSVGRPVMLVVAIPGGAELGLVLPGASL
jgi:hypothetical protein